MIFMSMIEGINAKELEKTFIENVKMILKSRGISQKDYAKAIGMSSFMVSRVLNRRSHVSTFMVLNTSVFLQIKVMQLFKIHYD